MFLNLSASMLLNIFLILLVFVLIFRQLIRLTISSVSSPAADSACDSSVASEVLLSRSTYDNLTGLLSKDAFDTAVYKHLSAGKFPFAIIIGDINGLKLINEACTSAGGDLVIYQAAYIFGQHGGHKAVLARTGGGEFSMLIPGADENQAQAILKSIQKSCRSEVCLPQDFHLQLSLSIGYAVKTHADQQGEQLLRLAKENLARQKLLDNSSSHSLILASLKGAMQIKCYDTKQHADRMARMARQTGIVLGMPMASLDQLELLAILHDIGKVAIPDSILQKPGPLNDDEWAEMKKHPLIGSHIASSIPELLPIADDILCHHERWDGTGYQLRLRQTKIPLAARIIAVVDAFDAMTEDRPYRSAMSRSDALDEIRRQAGTQFDPDVVQAFLDLAAQIEAVSVK